MSPLRRFAVWTGCALLALTAMFHLSGLPTSADAGNTSGSEAFYDVALSALWLSVGLHWLTIAVVCGLATRFPLALSKTILQLCAAILLVDALVLYWFIGPFIGSFAVATAAIAFTLGSVGKTGTQTAEN